jgi:hypothetical protein
MKKFNLVKFNVFFLIKNMLSFIFFCIFSTFPCFRRRFNVCPCLILKMRTAIGVENILGRIDGHGCIFVLSRTCMKIDELYEDR